MNTEQARRIVALHDNHDRALQNLRNAAAMHADDARAERTLEAAGDAYAASLVELRNAKIEAAPILMPDGTYGTFVTHARGELGRVSPEPAQPSGSAPGADDPQPVGAQVQEQAPRGTTAEGRPEPVSARQKASKPSAKGEGPKAA